MPYSTHLRLSIELEQLSICNSCTYIIVQLLVEDHLPSGYLVNVCEEAAMEEGVVAGKSLDPSAQLNASAPSRGGSEVKIPERMLDFPRGSDASCLEVRFAKEDRILFDKLLKSLSRISDATMSHSTGRTNGDQEAESESAGVIPGSMGKCSSGVGRSPRLQLRRASRNSAEPTLSEEDLDYFRSCMFNYNIYLDDAVDCEKLKRMVNDHPELLQEVDTGGCTVLHVAVLASSEELVDKVLEVAFKDGPQSATARQLLDADDKGSKLTAYEMAAIIGKPTIVDRLKNSVVNCLGSGKPYERRSSPTEDPDATESCLQGIRVLLEPVLFEPYDRFYRGRTTRRLGYEFGLHLIAAGAPMGYSVLKCVCEQLDPSLLLTVLRLRDIHGRTPLHLAVERGWGLKSFIDALTSHGHGCQDMNVEDFAGRTPLHSAAALGDLDAVEVLLSHPRTNLSKVFRMEWYNVPGSRFDHCKRMRHMTALHLAAFHNHFLVVDALLKKSLATEVNPLCERTYMVESSQNCNLMADGLPLDDGAWTPFQVAASKGHVQTMQVFLKDKNSQSIKTSNVPALHLAAASGNPIAVKTLLASNKINPFSLDWLRNTALHYATRAGDITEVYGPSDFVSICQFTFQQPRLGKPKGYGTGVVACIDLLLQAGLDMEGENVWHKGPQLGASAPEDIHRWWYEKMANQTQEIKSNLVVAANSISVTAALVATASFVGPLQPPLGLSTNSDETWMIGYSEVNHPAVQAFFFATAYPSI